MATPPADRSPVDTPPRKKLTTPDRSINCLIKTTWISLPADTPSKKNL